jgi:hypothetical protein
LVASDTVLKKYFHYHSLKELAADIERLQLPILWKATPEGQTNSQPACPYWGIFSPNSLAIHPMEGAMRRRTGSLMH